jgi:hypothetical protein
MSAQPSPRSRPSPHATPRPEIPNRGDGARSLELAPEVARRRLRARLLVWAVGLVTVAAMFMLVAFHVFAAQSAFTLERLSKEQANEQLRYERLRNQVASESSADTVIRAADKLGMVQGPTVIDLPGSSAVGAAETQATLPAESSGIAYEKTKPALGATP